MTSLEKLIAETREFAQGKRKYLEHPAQKLETLLRVIERQGEALEIIKNSFFDANGPWCREKATDAIADVEKLCGGGT